VKDIYPGPNGSAPSALAVVDSTLYFSANDGVSGYELWKSDGSAEGTVRLADLYPGSTGSLAEAIVALPDGRAVFAAGHEQFGRELWQSDGTAEGTRLLTDLAPGLESSNPTALTVTGNQLCFVADNGQTGRELWCIPADSTPFNPSYLYLPTIGR